MTNTGDQLAKTQRAAAELRALIREAHEAAQELSAVLKSARTMVDQYAAAQVQAVLDHYTEVAQQVADRWHAEWKADAQHHMNMAADAMRQVVSVVEMHFDNPNSPVPPVLADVVIDLRGDIPQYLRGDDPAAIELLAQAPYKVVVGPANEQGAGRS